MRFEWSKFIGSNLNVIMNEYYGIVHGLHKEEPDFYEIVFKSGKLVGAFDDGILLETSREGHPIKIYIPYNSIKCVEIFNL